MCDNISFPPIAILPHRAGDLSIPLFNSEEMERKNEDQMTSVVSTQELSTVDGKVKLEMAHVIISTT